MKTLIFLRHGKAEEKGPKIDDWTRALTDKGIKQTQDAIFIKKDMLLPVDAIISSAARRAKMTADVAAKVLGYDRNTILYDARLWTTDHMSILACITSLDEKRNTVLLVGHNDTLSDAMNALTPQNIGSIPKSGVVSQTFTASTWAGVSKHTWQKQWKYFGE